MADDAAPATPTKGGRPRSRSKFGTLMSRASKQMASGMAKGVVLAKQTAAEKIGKVALSEEKDPEIVSALQSLKRTKQTVTSLSAIVRNLYEAKVNEATYLTQLADTLKGVEASADDPFSSLLQRMGSALTSLEQVQSAHLERMEEQLVCPLERFLDDEVAQAQRLKLKYKNGKMQFDVAEHRLNKADGPKALHAAHKRDVALDAFSRNKREMRSQIERVEQVKQGELLSDLTAYWSSYTSFAQAQSNILTRKPGASRPVPPAPSRCVASVVTAVTGAPPRARGRSRGASATAARIDPSKLRPNSKRGGGRQLARDLECGITIIDDIEQIEGFSEHAAQSKPTIAKGSRRKRSIKKCPELVPVDSVSEKRKVILNC